MSSQPATRGAVGSGDSNWPILFFHIPKTGGTSMTAAVSEYFGKEDCIIGDLTVESLSKYEARLSDRVFIAGHWTHNIWRVLPERSLKFSVLRDPRDQAISNYLHNCRDLGERADKVNKLGLRRFVAENPYALVFQAGSLLVPQTTSLTGADEVSRNIEDSLAFINHLDFVGCLERPDDLSLCLPLVLGLAGPLTLPRINRAIDYGVSRDTILDLREAYDELRREPESGRLIEIEHRVYEAALALTRRREGMLSEVRQTFSPRGALSSQLHFAANDPAIQTEIGEKVDGLIRLRSREGCGVFGPYVNFPMGKCTARIGLVGPRQGRVTIDVAAECGETVLASRVIDLGAVEGDVLTLSTILSRPFSQCEVRLFCDSDVHAYITGMDISLVRSNPASWSPVSTAVPSRAQGVRPCSTRGSATAAGT